MVARDNTSSGSRSEVACTLASAISSVALATPGERKRVLSSSASALGKLVRDKLLDRTLAQEALIAAAVEVGLARREAEIAIRCGMEIKITNSDRVDAQQGHSQPERRPANVEAQAVRRKRLRDSATALRWLTENGLSPEAIERFQFGLEKPYDGRAGRAQDALTFPLLLSDGTATGTICKAEIPGVTKGAASAWWCRGAAQTFYATAQASQAAVLLCEMPDLWCVWQAIQGTAAAEDLQILASTHSTDLPAEWKGPEFWHQWESVFIGTAADSNGDHIAETIARWAAVPTIKRVRPDGARTWRDCFVHGMEFTEFAAYLESAPTIAEPVSHDADTATGRFPYTPIDIGRAFHNGHLFYPCTTVVKQRRSDAHGGFESVEHKETVVVRSDGQVLSARQAPAPPGTPPEARVIYLSDGTTIDAIPRAPDDASWSWESIRKWTEARAEGRSLSRRHLREIVWEAIQILRRAVWLRFDEEYTVLALVACASYCQAIFQAVPLVLICGEPGSGKSTAAIATAALSANGTVVTQVSAAAAARLLHETKGLVVIDDLEGIRPGRKANFDLLTQLLKVGYNRDTGCKVVSEATKGFSRGKLSVFGIKIVTNTAGVDAILGSRMLRIHTQRMPDVIKAERAGLMPCSATVTKALRDELHIWTFEHVAEIAAMYDAIYPTLMERDEEISAPLRVLARLCDDKVIIAQLETALARSAVAPALPVSARDILWQAATNIARQGYAELSVIHVTMEMQRLLDGNSNETASTAQELQSPVQVGRMLRAAGIVSPADKASRFRLYGVHVRSYPFAPAFVDQALEDHSRPPHKGPTEFCSRCTGCQYRTHCSLAPKRLDLERRGTNRYVGRRQPMWRTWANK